MSSLNNFIAVMLLTAALLVFPSHGFSGVICEYDVLGLSPGITQKVARELILERGFREIPVGRNGGMMFTNEEPWPPVGVELNRQQLRMAAILQNPRRTKALEKRAETDPSLKKLLAELPPIPPKGDVTDVRIELGRSPGKNASDGEVPIARIYVEYRFPADVNGRGVVYSPSHRELNRARWAKYCSGVDVSGLRDRRFMETDGNRVRVCQDNPGASGYPVQISLQPTPAAGKRGCSYTYMAGPLTSSEHIK